MTHSENTLKGVVRYDGTPYAGWQVQPGQRTVQGELEAALSQIAGTPVPIIGAGRTDAGVHALGQTFSFRWPQHHDWERLPRALSGMLGPHLRIESLELVSPEFHARKDAKSKRYGYTIALTRHADPFLDRYAWTVAPEFDSGRISSLADRVCGYHDFDGFCCAGSSVQDTRRTIFSIEVRAGCIIGPCDAKDCFHLIFHGDGFLYKMVRNLVGTFVDIARGQLDESTLEERLRGEGPYRGFTAPAKGLVLMKVNYV